MALKGLESFAMPVEKIGRTSSIIIRHLSKEFPSERLGNGRNGVADIKRHKWFQVSFWLTITPSHQGALGSEM